MSRRMEGLSLNLLDLGVALGGWSIATIAAARAADIEVTSHLGWLVVLAAVGQVVIHRLVGMYGPVWQYASVHEAVRVVAGVGLGTATATALLGAATAAAQVSYPLAMAPPLAALLTLLGCGGIRFQSRLFAVERQAVTDEALRTIIVGAGAAGAALAHELHTTDVGCVVDVVGFVDEEPAMVGRSLRGLPVLGVVEDLDRLCVEHRIDRVLVTTSTAAPEIRQILGRALETEAKVKVLPAASERVAGPLVGSLRDLDVSDLLGRRPAPIDPDGIGSYLRGATVLVTGAGGSIGSEIAVQVASFGPARLLLLDRDETLLHDLVTGPLAGVDVEPVLADICDPVRIDRLFVEHRPDVVFHAAAQKHVPILERYPSEAVRINVLGTLSLARIAAERGCRRFVHVSTDKAADPRSVMGATKRLAEQVVFEVGRRYSTPFVAVRFGNVLASRGSVVPTFLRQILEGGPVTVTDPAMTRYFMTIPEAVGLVLQSGSMADEQRIFLLDMGEPVSIMSLADQMIRLAGLRPGEDVDIVVTGLRPGERLHERLSDDAEVLEPAAHEAIQSLRPKATWEWDRLVEALDGLGHLVDGRDDDAVRRRLEDVLCTGGVDCVLEHPAAAATTDLRTDGEAARPVPAAPSADRRLSLRVP